jgi:hypothetical protein
MYRNSSLLEVTEGKTETRILPPLITLTASGSASLKLPKLVVVTPPFPNVGSRSPAAE